MIVARSICFTLGLAAVASAQAPTVAISIGLRETGLSGDYFSQIGGFGTTVGGIEWVNLDGQQLVLDGTWQKFTFDLANDPITPFAGTPAPNGILEGGFGTLEHIRVLNTSGIVDPITLWVDDVTETTNTTGPVNFSDFQGYNDGDEVLLQEPDFSGSTAANILQGSTAGVRNIIPSRSSSYRLDFQFVDATTTRWVRLTTFQARNLANPQVRFDDGSIITFWMRGGECQEDLGLQGPGNVFAEMCGSGLNLGESSIYATSGAQPFFPGVLAISLANQPDLPILGGILASGTGLAGSIGVSSDANGMFSFPVNGDPTMIDLVLQTIFLDPLLPQSLAFSNAVKARFGQ